MINTKSLSLSEKCYVLVTSGLGIGFIPIAPGTFGTIPAIAMFYFIPDKITLSVIALLLLWIGIIFASILERKFEKDPQWIVIDEIVGMLIPCLFISFDWIQVIIAFALFRFFDILKPLGIKRLQKMRGGMGVMIDDVLAGVYTLISMLIIHYLS